MIAFTTWIENPSEKNLKHLIKIISLFLGNYPSEVDSYLYSHFTAEKAETQYLAQGYKVSQWRREIFSYGLW